MPLTGTRLSAHVTHALGKTLSAGLDLYEDIINPAIAKLWTSHDWDWRLAIDQVVPTVAGSKFVPLPDDFGICRHVTTDGPSSFGVVMDSLDRVLKYHEAIRITGEYTAHARVWFPAWTHDSSAPFQIPEHQAVIYPLPASDGDPTLRVTYEKRPPRISASNAGQQIPIPPEFEKALIYAVRAEAHMIENQDPSLQMEYFQMEMQRLSAEEGRGQVSLGQMTGGATRYGAAMRPEQVTLSNATFVF